MRIDFWSDVVCPWCAIGTAHLDRALEQFEHADETYVIWRSFELDPGAPATRDGSYEEQLARKYSTSARGGRAMVGRLAAAAEAAGVQARFDLVRPTGTFDAHRLLHLAKAYGVQEALARRLTSAYLAEGELLSDHATLQRLAEGVGLVPEKVRRTLAGDAFGDAVRADQDEAARREITAVPTFLVAGRFVVPGAQTPDSLLATLRRAWVRHEADQDVLLQQRTAGSSA